MKLRGFLAVWIFGLFFPLLVFAENPSLDELEREVAAQEEKYVQRSNSIRQREERERVYEPVIIVTDPDTKKFADLPAVVRLRVTDALGTKFGTGSVIMSDEGQALIVTVSHIFRNVDDKSVISADVFNAKTGKIETFIAGYKDIKKTNKVADVGLLLIPTNRVLPRLYLASPDDILKVGQEVVSYGCGGGEPPTSLRHKITVFNRYTGPDTIECTGVPLEGRSGGALVTKGSNKLIGITIAADQRDQRGLYTGLAPIRAILWSVGIDPHMLEKPPVAK